jgi:hypothetical protein
MQYLEGSGTPILYIGRTVVKGQYAYVCPKQTVTVRGQWIYRHVRIHWLFTASLHMQNWVLTVEPRQRLSYISFYIHLSTNN